MAAALAIAPDALLRSDDEVLDELVKLTQRKRTEELWSAEMRAVQVELTHAVWRLLAQVNSKRGATLPAPLKVPRPWATREQKPKAQKMSLSDFVRRLGRGN